MEVIKNEDKIMDKQTAVALGSFDGLHKGHKELINTLKLNAEKRDLKTGVFTFINHPAKIINEKSFPKLISDNDLKIQILNDFGVEFIYMLDFNKSFMKMTPEEFVKNILVERLKAKLICVGFNYRFGKKGLGDTKKLNELGKRYGFEVIVIPPVRENKNIVSSTYIRSLLTEGHIKEANELLERNYSLKGKVVKGKGIGKELGFPTANLSVNNKYLIPKPGVYKTYTVINDKRYLSVTSIGKNPTFNNNNLSVETHILDFNKNLYNKTIKIEFLQFLRGVIKFKNKDQLITQVDKDIKSILN
ncbi:MAG: bifunctional riboflavin kinase/FAD synthetase [Firmicutes bacterium]|nr:bifunctional riboflavin kinase/FAD synthetase [Bacillota bacterium]